MSNKRNPLLPGTKLNKGKYVVKSLLRSSSMSNVYLIEDVPFLNRKMILKELFYESWEHEKETVLEIGRNYPIYDWYIDDFIENKIPYFVMQYIEGRTLENFEINNARNRIQKFNCIVNLSIQLVEFACKLHKNHIIHGDISPDNIIITEKKELYLIDYGNSLVSKGICCYYKEGYSAPELKNCRYEIDLRCDIYSIGATMYYMETKKFVGGYKWRKLYGKEFHRIICKCLNENPNDRFYSARRMYLRLLLCKYKIRLLIMMVAVISFALIFIMELNKYLMIKDGEIYYDDSSVYYTINNRKAIITGSDDDVTDIIIPAKIKGFRVQSIEGINKNVTRLNISEGVERIESYAFENCQYLKEIIIPTSVEYIDEYAFVNCGQLEDIKISSRNQFYFIESGNLVDKRNGNSLVTVEEK